MVMRTRRNAGFMLTLPLLFLYLLILLWKCNYLANFFTLYAGVKGEFLLWKNNRPINLEISVSLTTKICKKKKFTYPHVGDYSKMFQLFLRVIFRKHWYSKDMCGVKIYFLSCKWQNVFWICLCNTHIASFATTVSRLKICDFSGENFKGFDVL